MTYTNPMVTDTLRPGTRDWQRICPATAREIEGYASATSVNCAEVSSL